MLPRAPSKSRSSRHALTRLPSGRARSPTKPTRRSESESRCDGGVRNDDLPSFLKVAAADPKLLNARRPEGSTPFMYAVLYSNMATLERLLKQGAGRPQQAQMTRMPPR